MTRTVTVAELREKLEEIIEEVEAGGEVTIVPNNLTNGGLTFVQRGVPYPFRNLQISPLPQSLGDLAVQMLIEERDRERSGKKYE